MIRVVAQREASNAGTMIMRKPKAVWMYEDVALVLIDFQKEMFETVRSETPAEEIELNVRFLVRVAKALNIPIILSTVGVQIGVNGPTRQAILDELPGVKVIDRTSMDAWEDKPFRAAVEKTRKKRLIFAALWTEICLTFPVLEVMRDGYEAMFVVDASGGTTQIAHRTAIDRLTAAGAVPNTSLALTCELFRDWKSPVVPKVREAVGWYQTELHKLNARPAA
jgi:nicotinamidase-related amidase